MRGPQVMQGYLNNPKRPPRMIDARRLAAQRRRRDRRRGRLVCDRRPRKGADQVQGLPGRSRRARGDPDHPPPGGRLRGDRRPGRRGRGVAEGVCCAGRRRFRQQTRSPPSSPNRSHRISAFALSSWWRRSRSRRRGRSSDACCATECTDEAKVALPARLTPPSPATFRPSCPLQSAIRKASLARSARSRIVREGRLPQVAGALVTT